MWARSTVNPIRCELAGLIIALRRATERLHRRVHSLDGLSLKPWSRRFVDPIQIKGKPIVTLKEAAAFILNLSKVEQAKPHWQAATEAVIMAAEDRGPLMHADIGMKRALSAGKPVEFDPKQKSPHWGKRKLKRDEGKAKVLVNV